MALPRSAFVSWMFLTDNLLEITHEKWLACKFVPVLVKQSPNTTSRSWNSSIFILGLLPHHPKKPKHCSFSTYLSCHDTQCCVWTSIQRTFCGHPHGSQTKQGWLFDVQGKHHPLQQVVQDLGSQMAAERRSNPPRCQSRYQLILKKSGSSDFRISQLRGVLREEKHPPVHVVSPWTKHHQ